MPTSGKYTMADVQQPKGQYSASDIAETSTAAAPPATPDPAQKGLLSSFADASGLSSIPSLIAHPIDSVTSMAKGLYHNTVDNVQQGFADYKKGGLSTNTRRDFGRAVPIVGPALAEAQAQHDAGNNSGMAGTLAGTIAGLAGPKAISDALPKVGPALTATGEASQDAGIGLLNKTVGTLKNDFKRGANPARGYFEAGNGPSLSMQSIADKALNSKKATGRAMADLRAGNPTPLPTSDITKIVAEPIAKARELELGPGGLGNTATINNYAARFQPTFDNAFESGNGMTPEDVFQLKRGIAQNTNWSDPSQFNLKAVRQQQTAALGDYLNNNIPGYGEMAQRYGDLTNLAKRAQGRAETGSSPLTSLAAKGFHSGVGALATGLGGLPFGHAPEAALGGALLGAAVDSVPVKSTVASGLFYGGKGLSATGKALTPLPAPDLTTIAPTAYYLSKKADDKPKAQDK